MQDTAGHFRVDPNHAYVSITTNISPADVTPITLRTRKRTDIDMDEIRPAPLGFECPSCHTQMILANQGYCHQCGTPVSSKLADEGNSSSVEAPNVEADTNELRAIVRWQVNQPPVDSCLSNQHPYSLSPVG